MKRQLLYTETYDLFFNKICQFHKCPLEYACLERNCYSKIRQICTKCVRKTHSNHKIADMSLLISHVEQIKCMIIQSTAQFEKGFYSLPLNVFKNENILKIIGENYKSYQYKMETLIVKIIELSINLKKYEEFDQYNECINKSISLVGKAELIDFYFKHMPNKWLKQLQLKIKNCYESINESDVLINFFDHYRFNQVTQKKIILALPSYRGLKLTNLGGSQLVIIQSTKLYILELDDNKQRLLTHEVDTKINQVYQYKQQQNLLITCGQTLPILVSNRIFNISNNYLLRVDFVQGQINIMKRVAIKNLKKLLQYDNRLIICQVNSNSIYIINLFTMKVVSTFKIKYIIDQILLFPSRNEVLLFSNEKLIIVNILNKKVSCISGFYNSLKKKKLDQSHYALWNQNIVEIFDILKSHLKPVVTLQIPIIDIEIIQGKIFLVGKDKILHILN
ncbi:hypothetical protein ABPG72_005156 [Tetrahymena utriculariae]